ncbi:MAG: DNA recombination protein RmuC [Candidatus Yonathbacteria bacterium]|nr:DNA recombination protein RmuC [Candidatus Yonathbacteria bacterium]NTW47906.1 DNA recombination protein RmuC [Candidatus Yonathbacteria bacterium]
MDTLVIIILAIIVGTIIGIIVARFLRSTEQEAEVSKTDGSTAENFMLLQNQLENLTRAIDGKLGESRKEMQDAVRTQFSESQRLIRDVNEQMTSHLLAVKKEVAEVGESSKQVFTLAEQLQNLEKVLKHQKQRGNLGEASLELSLGNILPPTAYAMQHLFKNGDQVDAIIKTKEGFIPIDAKFSLDNYNRIINETDESKRGELETLFRNDLKKRIDETAKYIRPEEGTLPFAFMYIPAEGIYYDLLVNEVGAIKVNTRSLIDYAYNDKKVIIVSPTTFAAYLQSVLYGFKAFRIEEHAMQIEKQVGMLTKHLNAYQEYFSKVGSSLSTTVNHYDKAQKELAKIDKDVFKITDGEESIGFEPIALEKPQMREE